MTKHFFTRKGFIFIIPIILLYTLTYNVKEIQHALINTVDPEYIHLVSSVSMANGEFEVKSIENPASTLYFFGGLLSKATYFLVGTESNLIEDYIENPEKYVSALRASLIFCTVLSLIFLGYYAYKWTENLSLVFFFQSIPFISKEILYASSIISPENFIIIVMLWYIIVLLKDKYTEQKTSPYLFAVINALGLGTKLTFVPLAILPLALLVRNTDRIKYIVATVVFTLLFIFPVLLQADRFISWISNLFFHSGNYGKGPEEIVNTHVFGINLRKIFTLEFVFSVVYVLNILSILYLVIKKKTKSKTFKVSVAVMLVCTLQIVLTAKHFALRYLIPSMMLTLYIAHNVLSNFSFGKRKRIELIFYFLCSATIIGTGTFFVTRHVIQKREIRSVRQETRAFIEKQLKGQPILIVPNYYGSATTQYALCFSSYWLKGHTNELVQKLNKKYPETYFYFQDRKKFKKWNNITSLTNILMEKEMFYVYQNKEKDEPGGKLIMTMRKHINQLNTRDSIVHINKVYTSAYDEIYQLRINNKKVHELMMYKEISCDMESFDLNNSSFESKSGYKFKHAKNQSNKAAFSGSYSQQLSPKYAWGISTNLKRVQKGSCFSATIWVKSNDHHCLLVASEKNGGFYEASNEIVEEKKGWKKIRLSFDLSDKRSLENLSVYPWYRGNEQIFVDDFKIKVGTIELDQQIL